MDVIMEIIAQIHAEKMQQDEGVTFTDINGNKSEMPLNNKQAADTMEDAKNIRKSLQRITVSRSENGNAAHHQSMFENASGENNVMLATASNLNTNSPKKINVESESCEMPTEPEKASHKTGGPNAAALSVCTDIATDKKVLNEATVPNFMPERCQPAHKITSSEIMPHISELVAEAACYTMKNVVNREETSASTAVVPFTSQNSEGHTVSLFENTLGKKEIATGIVATSNLDTNDANSEMALEATNRVQFASTSCQASRQTPVSESTECQNGMKIVVLSNKTVCVVDDTMSSESARMTYFTPGYSDAAAEMPVTQSAVFENSAAANEERKFGCEICLKRFKKKSHLKTHMDVHSGEKPFKCEICGKAFSRNYSLTIHTRIHTKEKPYKCQVCGKSFTVPGHLKSHFRVHTGEKPFKCEVCGEAYIQASHLKIHQVKHSEDARPYHCPICPAAFTRKYGVMVHMQSHAEAKTFCCQICNKTYKRKQYLKSHMQTHFAEKPFKCATCDRAFTHKVLLDKHLIRHQKIRPYACSVCFKTFAGGSELRVHKMLHESERKYACPFCSKKFAQNANMKTHILCHTGEKPYKCMVCDMSFRQNAHLKKHMKSHENSILCHTEEKPHSCMVCDMAFRQNVLLEKHMKCHENGVLLPQEAATI